MPCFGCQMFKKWPLKLGRMYQTAPQNDGFNTLRLYCSKLNPAYLCYDSKPAKLHKARWAIQLLHHLLGLRNRASSYYFLERSSAVTFILKFLFYRVVNLLILFFYRTLGISPKDLERLKADIAFIYTTLAFHKLELWFDFCNAKFHWFVRYQMRVFIWFSRKMIA